MVIAMTGREMAERRSSPRRSSAQCAWLIAARLRPGRDVQVLDLSSGGALVEAGVRLLPGAPVVLHLVGDGGAHTIRGIVLRCYVSALDRCAGVRYRAALAFDQSFRIPDDKGVTRSTTAACEVGRYESQGTGS
jgi:hypothetical protein